MEIGFVLVVFFIVALGGYALMAPSGGGIGSMQTLSAPEIATYAANAGFTGTDLQTAVAVALAESSGNPGAVGDVSLGGSIGLWQIYTVAHPEFDQSKLTDPQYNADAAFQVYSAAGNSFSPWSTYKNGAYQAYLQQASDAVNP